MRIPSGSVDRKVFFVAVDSTDLKTRETGLSSFTVVYSLDGAADVTYTTPTVTEIDSSTMPGVYALTLDESGSTTLAAGHDTEELCLHITQASMAPVTRVVEVYRVKFTEGQAATMANSAVDADVERWLGTVVTANTPGVPNVDVDRINNVTSAATALSRSVDMTGANMTADSGTTTTLTDAALTQADTDYWKGNIVVFSSGTLKGQARLITAFDPATDTITFTPATTVAVGTHNYVILPAARVDVARWIGSALATPDTAGYPVATIKDGTGAGEIALTAGKVDGVALVDLTTTTTTATNVTTVNGLAANVITAASIATGAIDADAIADNAIDAGAIASDAVTELRSLVSGTSDSGSTTTMVDAARTEADTDYWKGAWILFTSGTISGQCRLITAFDPGTDTITFAPATTQAVATQTYEILPAAAVDLRLWNGTAPNNLISGRVDANTQVVGTGAITTGSFAAGAIDNAAFNVTETLNASIVSGGITAASFAAGAIDAAAIATGAIDADALAADAGTEIGTAVWASATRVLTAGTNIVLAKGVGVTGFNDLSAAQVNAEVVDCLATDTYAEPTGAPAATDDLATKLGYLYMALRNGITVSATAKTFLDDGGAAEWSKALTDDGITYQEAEGA